MKAAVVRAFDEPLVIEERPDPEPKVSCETRPPDSVNESSEDVPRGDVTARIGFDLVARR
ncbi:hypothetical protein ACIO53_03400 [Streptomyces sp. NPDC087305]|uniref:hypothetical protein n=1 Tax=Streptomyces sp. NPDC087305 TaxID=3365781 RepID=UPI003809732A